MFGLIFLVLALGPAFQRASVVQMDLAHCAVPRHSFLSTMSGVADTAQHDTCAEYVLRSATVVFRLQSKKSELLLIPGEVVSFRTGKGKLYLRRDDENSEVEGTVLCMRSLSSNGDSCGVDINALEQPDTRAARRTQ